MGPLSSPAPGTAPQPTGPGPAGPGRHLRAAAARTPEVSAAGFEAAAAGAFATPLQDRLLAIRRALDGDRPVSGEALARQLGLSRTSVWKIVRQLRQLGYRLEGSPRRGYRLLQAPDVPYPWEVHLEPTGRLGHPLLYWPEVGSTSDELRRLAEAGAPEGTVVVADRQLQGRGRRGRSWASPSGGLWFSVLLRPRLPTRDAAWLALAAGLAVVEALEPLCGVPLAIKWPNDVLADRRKLCGILAELDADHETVRHVILGIGINARTPHLDNAVPGLQPVGWSDLGCTARRPQLLAAVLRELDRCLQALQRSGPRTVAAAVQRRLAWKGEVVQVDSGAFCLEGRLEGVHPDTGMLWLRAGDGRRLAVASGDVSLRAPAAAHERGVDR